MKGLDLAEQYFFEYGLPMLKSQFPGTAQCVAAGLVGPGSECYGFDDHLSRDHDWGPGFCLWINAEDFRQIGARLQAAYQSLPDKYKGYGPRVSSPGEEHRVGVAETAHFYKSYTGLGHPPVSIQEWLRIPDEALSITTNGKVFWDPSGQFSSWRKELKQYYPEDIRVYKIATLCVRMAQSGQYNFKRSLQREEKFAYRFAEMEFCDQALSMTFLLVKQYAPFYKWRHHAVKAISSLGLRIYAQINTLLTSNNYDQKLSIIDSICKDLIAELVNQKLSDSYSDFLLDHLASITNRINERSLHKRFSTLN